MNVAVDHGRSSAAGQPARVREPVTRALQLITFMVDDGKQSYGVRDIAEGLGMPASSVHRLLRLLQQAAMITHDERGTYSLAAEFYRLAWKATSGHGLREAAMPHLRRLVSQIDETAMLGLYDSSREQVMLVASVESTQQLRYVTELHQWMPLTHGSTGLGILSFLPEPTREQIISAELADASSEELAQLRTDVDQTRRRGYAVYRRHHEPTTVGISVPIWDSTAHVVGDVFVAMPASRYQPRREHTLAESVQIAAGHVTRSIGGRVDEALPLGSSSWRPYCSALQG
ncbi:IclR family transcriptional regulator [Streptomyces sp. NPDC004752]